LLGKGLIPHLETRIELVFDLLSGVLRAFHHSLHVLKLSFLATIRSVSYSIKIFAIIFCS
jgi:hypothetical protein